MSAAVTRRTLFLGSLAALAGCGFRPLYVPGSQQDTDLGAVFVDIIPNRNGQLLREALQAKLEGSDNAISKRFVLGVAYAEHANGIGIQSDNSSTRTRVTGDATWSLRAVGTGTPQITGGVVRSLDGFNIIDEQYFYSDLSQDAADHRLADNLADQITQALSLYFRSHPNPA